MRLDDVFTRSLVLDVEIAPIRRLQRARRNCIDEKKNNLLNSRLEMRNWGKKVICPILF